MNNRTNIKNVISWLLRITASIILLQTLYFKFTGHRESIDLFTKLGVEPWGRIGTGIIEFIACLLLLFPSTIFMGALLTIGLMFGAIVSHLTVLGIESKGDGGQLFILAIIVLLCSFILLVLHKKQGITLFRKFIKQNQ